MKSVQRNMWMLLVSCVLVAAGSEQSTSETLNGDGSDLIESLPDYQDADALMADSRRDSIWSNPPTPYKPHSNDTVTEERSVTSEQRKDGIHHKVTITKKIRVPFTIQVEKRIPKIIEVPVDKPFNVYVPKPYPVIVEKKVPYEVQISVPQPYTVEKKVPYPVKVLVDKPYTVHVPKPYPVEVDKKVEFTVEKKVPYEVKVPVERPYPVHVIVEKEVKYPVETKVPVLVKIPYDKPMPIHVKKHVPVLVDKPVPYTVEKVATYPVKVPFKIPIKVHYPEGDSPGGIYFDSSTNVENVAWSDAMSSSKNAIKGFDQHNFRPLEPQGYSGMRNLRRPHFRNGYQLDAGKNFRLSHRPFHPGKPFYTTKLRSISSTQNNGNSYQVNEAQVPFERPNNAPFVYSNPNKETKESPQPFLPSTPEQPSTKSEDNKVLMTQAISSVYPSSVINFNEGGKQKDVLSNMQKSSPIHDNLSLPPHKTSFQKYSPQIDHHFREAQIGHSSFPSLVDLQTKNIIPSFKSSVYSNVPSATHFKPIAQNDTSFIQFSLFPQLTLQSPQLSRSHQPPSVIEVSSDVVPSTKISTNSPITQIVQH